MTLIMSLTELSHHCPVWFNKKWESGREVNQALVVRKGLASKSTLHTSGFVINQASDDHTNLGEKMTE